MEKLPSSGSAVPELEAVEGKINSLEDITCQIVGHFSEVSRIIYGVKFTIQELTHALKELSRMLLELGSAYAYFGQNIKRLTTQRDNFAWDMAQAVALEAKLEQIQKTMVE